MQPPGLHPVVRSRISKRRVREGEGGIAETLCLTGEMRAPSARRNSAESVYASVGLVRRKTEW